MYVLDFLFNSWFVAHGFNNQHASQTQQDHLDMNVEQMYNHSFRINRSKDLDNNDPPPLLHPNLFNLGGRQII